MIGLLHKAQMCHVHGDVDLFEILSFVIRGVLLTKGRVQNTFLMIIVGMLWEGSRARAVALHTIYLTHFGLLCKEIEKSGKF